MFLKKLSVKNWRALEDVTLEFGPGLNLVCGPNESGKTSLREALRCVFVSPVRSRGRSAVSAARPWGSKACPEVHVEFQHQEEEWVLRKVFFGSGSELIRQGKLIAKEESVQKALDEGLSDFSALWAVQGDTDLAEVPKALRPQLAAAEAVNPGITWLDITVNKLYEEFWTDKQERPKPPVKDVRDRTYEAERGLGELRNQIAGLDRANEDVERLDKQLAGLKQQEQEPAETVAKMRSLLSEWESYRKRKAQEETLKQGAEQITNWLQRWDEVVNRVEGLRIEAAKYERERKEHDAERLSEPDRKEIEALEDELVYCRERIQMRLREELDQLGPPGPDGLTKLKWTSQEVQALEKALQRLGEALDVDAEVQQLDDKVKEATANEGSQARVVEAAESTWKQGEGALEAAKRAHEAKVGQVEGVLRRWNQQSDQFLALWESLDEYRRKLESLDAQMGSEPSRDGILQLQADHDYLKVRHEKLLHDELANLSAPQDEDVKRLELLVQRSSRMEEALKEKAELDKLGTEREAAEKEVREWEGRVGSLSSDVEREQEEVAGRERRAGDVERRLGATRERQKRWDVHAGEILRVGQQLEGHQAKVAEFRDKVGPEPNRDVIDGLQAALTYSRARVQQLLHEQQAALNAPSQEDAQKLEDLERRVGSAPEIPAEVGGSKIGGFAALAIVLGAVGFVVPIALGLALAVSIVAGLVGLSIGGVVARTVVSRRSAERRRIEAVRTDLVRERDEFSGRLGVQSSSEARDKYSQSVGIRALLELDSPPAANDMANLRKESPNAEELDDLDLGDLRDRVNALPGDISAAERDWKSLRDSQVRRQGEYEELLRESPEQLLKTEIDHICRVADEDEALAAEVPESTNAPAWIAALKDGSLEQFFARNIDGLGSQHRELTKTTGSSELSEALSQARQKLGDAQSLHQTLTGGMVPVQARFSGLCNELTIDHPDNVEAQSKALVEKVNSTLADLGVENIDQARERAREAVALRGKVDSEPPGAEELSRLAAESRDSERIDQLSPGALRDEIQSLPTRITTAEDTWKASQDRYKKYRGEYETELNRNPESQLATHLAQFRGLASEMLDVGLTVPDEVTEAWVAEMSEAGPAHQVERFIAQMKSEFSAEKGRVSSADAKQHFDQEGVKLSDLRKVTGLARRKQQHAEGESRAKREEFNRLLKTEPPLRSIPQLREGTDLSARMNELRDRFGESQTQLTGQLSHLGVASVEEAGNREDKAKELRGRLKPPFSPDQIQELKRRLEPTDRLDGLSQEDLVGRIATIPDEVTAAENRWKASKVKWASQQEDEKKRIGKDPKKLVEAGLGQLRTLVAERTDLDVTIPEDPSDIWMADATEGRVCGPVMELLEAETKRLSEHQQSLQIPELDETTAGSRLESAKHRVEENSRRQRALREQINQQMGSLKSQSEVFAHLTRAEETHQAKFAEQRGVEREAAARKLLRAALTHSKKELENDLVGPLRDRISQRLVHMTSGRYRAIRMEQDFKAQTLITADRTDAPLQDVSFGTREQVVFLSRLCLAELLSAEERHLLVFDDNLVHSDEQRTGIACELLREVAGKSQIIMMTCHPERFASVLDEARVLEM